MKTYTQSWLAVIILAFATLAVAAIASQPTRAATTSVIYFDLAADESRQRLYGSDSSGGSIHVISQTTLQVISTVNVGLQPVGLDLSPDGNELAVGLFGAGKIALINLNTLTVTAYLTPTVDVGPNLPYDVVYGRPGRLYSVGNPGSSGFDYVHVFDTATRSEVGLSSFIIRAAPRLAITADKNSLLIGEPAFSPQQIYRFDVSTDTPTFVAQGPHGPVAVNTLAVAPDGSAVYTSWGQVWSGDLSTQLGTFAAFGSEIEYVPSLQRLAVSSDSGITLINAVNYSTVFSFPISGGAGVARANSAGTTLYVSTSAGIRVIPVNLRPSAYLPALVRNLCPDFFDDFSNPASGWPVGEDDLVRSEYLGGEYRVLSKNGDYIYLFRSPSCDRANYMVEADARWVDAPGLSYGIVFGITSGFGQYYLFDVSADFRDFLLARRDPSGFTLIMPPTFSSAINGGNASNHLKVTRNGSQITLEVNGTLLGAWFDGGIGGSTGAGIYSNPYTGPPISDARFDNFSMASLPDSGLAVRAAINMTAESDGSDVVQTRTDMRLRSGDTRLEDR